MSPKDTLIPRDFLSALSKTAPLHMRQRLIPTMFGGSVEEERRQVAFIWNELYAANRNKILFIGMGGIGKTFIPVRKLLKDRILGDDRMPFTYLVDNDETRKELLADNGNAFWGRVAEYGGNKALTDCLYSTDMSSTKRDIKYKGREICHVIPFSMSKKYKQLQLKTNFMFLDEFIPETLDYNNRQIASKFQSIAQGLQRDQQMKCIMCANPKTLDNPIIHALGVYGIKEGYFGYTPTTVVAWVAANQLPCIAEMNANTIAGEIAVGTGETHRLYGTVSLSKNAAKPIGEPIMNLAGGGFRVGFYNTADNKFCVAAYNPKSTTFVESKKHVMPGSYINKEVFEWVYKLLGTNQIGYDTINSEEAFLVVMGIKKYGE